MPEFGRRWLVLMAGAVVGCLGMVAGAQRPVVELSRADRENLTARPIGTRSIC
jgi:hypothetical protein